MLKIIVLCDSSASMKEYKKWLHRKVGFSKLYTHHAIGNDNNEYRFMLHSLKSTKGCNIDQVMYEYGTIGTDPVGRTFMALNQQLMTSCVPKEFQFQMLPYCRGLNDE